MWGSTLFRYLLCRMFCCSFSVYRFRSIVSDEDNTQSQTYDRGWVSLACFGGRNACLLRRLGTIHPSGSISERLGHCRFFCLIRPMFSKGELVGRLSVDSAQRSGCAGVLTQSITRSTDTERLSHCRFFCLIRPMFSKGVLVGRLSQSQTYDRGVVIACLLQIAEV